ncbi:MAG TPA: peptidase M14, partial [Silvibacterium sp.]|nr:peptidase M14 [Silvibacterium sp.]
AARLGAHPLGNQQFPLRLSWSGETTPFLFRGYHYTRQLSEVSGTMWIKYTHEPWDVSLPLATGFKVTASTAPPAAYIIPRQWTHVIDVLAAHQVEIQRTSAPWTGQVETYRCNGMQWNRAPFEGRHPIFPGEGATEPGKFGHCDLVTRTVTYPAGSAVIQLNQRLSKVALQWLEPEGPDSAMAWGFFDSIFEQKEYGEAYVLEKLAREMMDKDPKLKEEFERKIQNDPQFAADPYARLSFFYEHSPWYAANRVGEYPVGRLTKLDGVPLDK